MPNGAEPTGKPLAVKEEVLLLIMYALLKSPFELVTEFAVRVYALPTEPSGSVVGFNTGTNTSLPVPPFQMLMMSPSVLVLKNVVRKTKSSILPFSTLLVPPPQEPSVMPPDEKLLHVPVKSVEV